MDRRGRKGTEEDAMHMDDLWFDVAIHGEPDLEGDLIVRLHLSDGTESGPKGTKPVPAPAPDNFQPADAVDPF
jgi:hypothetical protein